MSGEIWKQKASLRRKKMTRLPSSTTNWPAIWKPKEDFGNGLGFVGEGKVCIFFQNKKQNLIRKDSWLKKTEKLQTKNSKY